MSGDDAVLGSRILGVLHVGARLTRQQIADRLSVSPDAVGRALAALVEQHAVWEYRQDSPTTYMMAS